LHDTQLLFVPPLHVKQVLSHIEHKSLTPSSK
jgi:hypothetical protein